MNKIPKIIEANHLKWIPNQKTVVDIEKFSIDRGEVVALIGPNGAGKSSLIKLLACLEKPTQGELFFDGQRVSGSSLHIRRQMAMVFQEPLLLQGNVFNNIAQGLRLRGIPKDEIDRRVRYWLSQLRIEEIAGRNVRYLSGGEAQRVSIARAMAVAPKVLFLDEPFAALDLPTRGSLIEEMGEILQSTNTAAVFITHNMEEIPLIASRVFVMLQGRMVQEGSPQEIFNFPVNEDVARLVGIENCFKAVVEGEGKLRLGTNFLCLSSRQLPKGHEADVFFRPEDVVMADYDKMQEKINVFAGRVQKILPLSSQLKIVVDCGFPVVMLVSKSAFFGGKIRPGQAIRIHIPPDKIHGVLREE